MNLAAVSLGAATPASGGPSSLSRLCVGVEVAEFYACVVGGEVPVDLTLRGAGGVLPGEFGVEFGEIVDAPAQASRDVALG
jgi:hypothetical protein